MRTRAAFACNLELIATRAKEKEISRIREIGWITRFPVFDLNSSLSLLSALSGLSPFYSGCLIVF